MNKDLRNGIIVGVIIFLVLLTGINSCSIVQERERGVMYTLGQVGDSVVTQGLHFKAPFVQKIKKYSISPKNYETMFSYGDDAAVTKDMQSVGCKVSVVYRYDDTSILTIAKKFGDSIIEDTLKRSLNTAVKTVIGKYSIYDLTSNQTVISNEAKENVKAIINEIGMPVVVDQVLVANWDWSEDFDKQIKETMNRTQQVRQAEQEANIAEAKAQIKVKEANANLEAAKLDAEARRVSADAEVYEKQQLAKVSDITYKTFAHEEQMKYYEKWDGHLVPTYIPLTAAGGIVNLKQ